MFAIPNIEVCTDVSVPSCTVSVSFVGFVSRQPLPLVNGSAVLLRSFIARICAAFACASDGNRLATALVRRGCRRLQTPRLQEH